MTRPSCPLRVDVKCKDDKQMPMARTELLRHCLDLHKDLLQIEQKLHDYLDGLRLQAASQ